MAKRKVGSKRELFPPKKIMEKLGLQPGTVISYSIEDNKLVVETMPTLEKAFREPKPIRITLNEFRGFRKKLSKEAEA
jgi:bifunctional DNA-binding transcriptional regulator/antitoxin component of YhaV-PrlF toxin-antitoxin module